MIAPESSETFDDLYSSFFVVKVLIYGFFKKLTTKNETYQLKMNMFV